MAQKGTILVAGGTSRLGRALVAELLARGWTVRALVRDPSRAPEGVEVRIGDVTCPETLGPACEGADVVFSAVGASVMPIPRWPRTTFESVDRDGNLALLEAARAAGVRKLVYVSVFGDYPPGVRYVEAHEEVAAAIARSGLAYTIVRPTGFHSVFAATLPLARLGLGAKVDGGAARTNPIAEEDLAFVCADAVEGDETEVAAGGPEVLTRDELARLPGRALGRRLLVLSAPGWLVRLQARLIRPLDRRIGDLFAFFAHVATHDAVAPVRGRRTVLESLRARAPTRSPPNDTRPRPGLP